MQADMDICRALTVTWRAILRDLLGDKNIDYFDFGCGDPEHEKAIRKCAQWQARLDEIAQIVFENGMRNECAEMMLWVLCMGTHLQGCRSEGRYPDFRLLHGYAQAAEKTIGAAGSTNPIDIKYASGGSYAG